MKNQKGYTLISFCFFLPIVFIVVFSCLWVTWFLVQKNRLENICHHHTLLAQQYLVKNNNKLLNLNRRAWQLYLEKKALQELIRSAPPQARLVLALRLRRVIQQQVILRKQQKSFIYTGNVWSKRQAFLLKKDFSQQVHNMAKAWNKPFSYPQLHFSWSKSQVTPLLSDIAPPYRRAIRHESKQVISLRWSIPMGSMTPSWLTHWVPLHKKAQGVCFSHPHKGGFQWVAAIGKGKH
ncbi:MAG: hypothetical protein KDD33_08645 [Bdellovibrionales bacterium]|nr:hypothetical protein [Bdellovibrionales bacterium]